MSKRELRIEISIQYNIPEWAMDEVIKDIRDAAKFHLTNPDIQITDEAVDDTPYKMLCPHCNGVISGMIISKE
jgi:hypothetical protein